MDSNSTKPGKSRWDGEKLVPVTPTKTSSTRRTSTTAAGTRGTASKPRTPRSAPTKSVPGSATKPTEPDAPDTPEVIDESIKQLSTLSVAELKQLQYQVQPDVYAKEILGVTWWGKQIEIAYSFVQKPKTFVMASHGIGKTMLGGSLVNYKVDCFIPSITITTAPSARQVERLLWGEVRVQRRGRPGLLPKDPQIWLSAQHYALGYTSDSGDAFQGWHHEHLSILFDEATGISAPFWLSADHMCIYPSNRQLAILNPTDTSSYAYQAWESGEWNSISVCAFEHPNVIAGLKGETLPYPGATTIEAVERDIRQYCEPLHPQDTPQVGLDFEWPPESGIWYRPGPIFEGRVLGRWPTQSTNAIWSMWAWEKACIRQPEDHGAPTEIGCDVARKGDDDTVIWVRRGRTHLHAERHNGWDTTRICERIENLCREWAVKNIDADSPSRSEDPFDIAIKVDDSGVGGGLTDLLRAKGFRSVPIIAQSASVEVGMYPNRRSELWFASFEMAKEGDLDLSRLPRDIRERLKSELFSPQWSQDAKGRRVVEPKDITKKRIRRSPDMADGFNLSVATDQGARMRWDSAYSGIVMGPNFAALAAMQYAPAINAETLTRALEDKGYYAPGSFARSQGRRAGRGEGLGGRYDVFNNNFRD